MGVQYSSFKGDMRGGLYVSRVGYHILEATFRGTRWIHWDSYSRFRLRGLVFRALDS